MPCVPVNRSLLTGKKQGEIKDALKRLEEYLARGTVKVVVGPQGAVAFQGWREQDRAGLGDVCAIRALTAESSFALRKAMATAEAASGRKVNLAQVGAGVHSHDGGRTWGRG